MSQPLTVKADSLTSSEAVLLFNGKEYACVIGRSGVKPEVEKQEGDGATPIGEYRILRGFYRPDRLAKPDTNGLEMYPISRDMGWEDDPASKRYNYWIESGYPKGEVESFWREDECYNVILVVDYNGAWPFSDISEGHPAIAGKGSAIFIHVLKRDADNQPVPTAGCVALEQDDLLEVISQVDSRHKVTIELSGI